MSNDRDNQNPNKKDQNQQPRKNHDPDQKRPENSHDINRTLIKDIGLEKENL
jgi:hypothetical protein